jgi:hypothetical protein
MTTIGAEGDGLTPAEALALLQRQQQDVTRQRGSFFAVIVAVWGVAWLLGFAALWLVDAFRPSFSLPLPLAIGAFAAMIVAGIVVSLVVGLRSNRGIRSGPSSAFAGTAYGLSWWLGIIGIPVLGGGLEANGMSPALANVFFPCAYIFFVGVMFVVAGIIWRAIPSIVGGVWMVIVAAVGSYLGHPADLLFFAVAGGGGFLALAAYAGIHGRRVRRG